MQMIADILLAAGALGAAIYCVVLAGRLKRFNNLQNGVGGAVAVLSVQVDDMTKTLRKAQKSAVNSTVDLTALTTRAEDVSKRLELVLASMHDLPDEAPDTGTVAKASVAVKENEPLAKTPADLAPSNPAKDAPEEGVLFLSNRSRVLEAAE